MTFRPITTQTTIKSHRAAAMTSVSVEFQWQRLGSVQRDEQGLLAFPAAPRRPGLYRFRLCGNGNDRHYIGETDELRRRFQQYRTPGRSQQTNIRINAQFRDHIAAGGTIEVDIVDNRVTVTAAGTPLDVELADKAMRRLLEHAALIGDAAAGVELLNR